MNLKYEGYGEGYPLIILHGLFGSLENWRTLSRAFARCYGVFALDLRNHGQSPHSNVFTYSALAGDVREFMRSHGLSSAYVLGHSLGGKVAMHLALTSPSLVNKLVVVDIAPKPYHPQHDKIFRALMGLDPKSFPTRKDMDAALAKELPDAALREFLLKNAIRDETGTLHWRIDLNALYRNYGEILRGIDAENGFAKPTLFIKGDLSGYITAGDVTIIKRLFPYSRIVSISGVGHWVHAQAHRKFARLVLAFLGSM